MERTANNQNSLQTRDRVETRVILERSSLQEVIIKGMIVLRGTIDLSTPVTMEMILNPQVVNSLEIKH